MPQVYYVVSGGSSNVNGHWLKVFLQYNNKGIRYITYGVLTALSIYVLAPSVSYLIFGGKMFSRRASGSKRSDKITTGLVNSRNDCFANSSVQALSALPKLTLYLNDVLRQASQLDSDLQERDIDDKRMEMKPDELADSSRNLGPSDSGLSQRQLENVATPKAELEQNPLDMHINSMIHASKHRPGLSALKSSATINTITTLKDDDNGDDETPAISLHEAYDDGDTPVDNSQVPRLPMHRSLASMLEQLQRTITTPRDLSVRPLLHCLEVIFNARISTGQNDAHELTQVILETLQKESHELREFSQSQTLSTTVPEIPFKGEIADHLVCTVCGNSSKVRTNQFIMHPLAVPQALQAKLADMLSEDQVETIEDYSCLTCKVSKILDNEKGCDSSKYSAVERNILASLSNALPNMLINDDLSEDLLNYIDGYEKDGCDPSKLKSTIVKRNVVVDAPSVLLIHLSRSIFNGVNYSRNSCAVNFEDVLHLQEQVIENNRCVGINRVSYKLKAIVKHSGSHSQGHYQCYRHKPDFVKDIDTHVVINRTPVIDVNLVNVQDPHVSKEKAATGMMEPPIRRPSDSLSNPPSNLSGTSLNRSTSSSSSNNEVGLENFNFDSIESSKMTRKPSTLKKLTNFLSGKTSVTQNLDSLDLSDSESTGRGRKITGTRSIEGHSSNPSAVRSSFSRSRNPSVVRSSSSRSRNPSAVRSTSSHSRNPSVSRSSASRSRTSSMSSYDRSRSRANSVSSNRSSSDFSGHSSESNSNWGTSASDADNTYEDSKAPKRHLKKIKSVVKYPYWLISDNVIREAKTEEVLNETKCVYMLFYERTDPNKKL